VKDGKKKHAGLLATDNMTENVATQIGNDK
jgi:hypothetical protein